MQFPRKNWANKTFTGLCESPVDVHTCGHMRAHVGTCEHVVRVDILTHGDGPQPVHQAVGTLQILQTLHL